MTSSRPRRILLASITSLSCLALLWPGSHPNATAQSGSQWDSKIKFRHEDGRSAYSLKLSRNDAKLVDPNEKELARYSFSSSDRLKIKNESDSILGWVNGTLPKLKLENADRNKVRFVLRKRDDGSWELENATGQRVYKIKPKEYGFKLVDAAGTEIHKVKSDSGKTSLRDSSGRTVVYTKETISNAAMACLGFDELELHERVGFLVRIQRGSGR